MMQLTQNRVAASRLLALGVLLTALMAIVLTLAAGQARATTTFYVNSTADHADALLTGDRCDTGYTVPGVGGAQVPECTLRAAIQQANYTPGADAINFAIPGSGVKTISPATQLPEITEAVSINGYSQGSATADPADDARPNTLATGAINAAPKIELNGQYAGLGAHGLEILGPNSVVRGLVINRFASDGIHIMGPGNKVAGNYIGTDPSGTLDLGNRYNGVATKSAGANSNTIGGSSPSARNLISGNGADNGGQGVDIDDGEGNQVLGNLIGTKKDGAGPLGNSDGGIEISDVSNTTVGGTTAATRNVISGNGEFGVEIFGADASGNKVMGNYIGTDASGTKDLGNSFSGVYIGDAPNASGAPNNTVGGTQAGARNVISGNEHSGVEIRGAGATGNEVVGNFVGTDKNGTAPLGNTYDGVNIEGSSNNTVGGTTAGERNVISGNRNNGVFILGNGATGNRVTGNYLGTDKNGTSSLGNTSDGVRLYDAPNNTVGGTTAGERNVISGNKNDGVFILGNGATGDKVIGNYIGTDASGTKDLGNVFDGVALGGGSNNTVGGTTAGERNVISGNGSDGVDIKGVFTTGNKVRGNYLGVDTNGAPLGNSANGVFVYDAPNNTIGGTTAGARNVISGNQGTGVSIFNSTATGVRILSNSIFANGGLGIDLGDDGPTANDALDTDTGPNNLQNKPVLTSAKTGSTTTTIRGTLNSTPDTTFTVQFFSNPSGTNEGKKLIGQQLVKTDGSGNASFGYSPQSKVELGQNITATATSPGGDTSEFSAPRSVVAQ